MCNLWPYQTSAQVRFTQGVNVWERKMTVRDSALPVLIYCRNECNVRLYAVTENTNEEVENMGTWEHGLKACTTFILKSNSK